MIMTSASLVTSNFNKDKIDSVLNEIEHVDSRSRFSHTKALFEQLERCGGDQLPSFYSPRLQRSATVPTKLPLPSTKSPVVPPKPCINFVYQQQPLNTSVALPDSALSQVVQNFSQLTSDIERIATLPRNSGIHVHSHHVSANEANNFNDSKFTNSTTTSNLPTIKSKNLTHQLPSLTPSIISSDKPINNIGNNLTENNSNNNYEPYWRDSAFYKRRLGVENNGNCETSGLNEGLPSGDLFMQEDENNLSESGESVPSEPRPSPQQNKISQNANLKNDFGNHCQYAATAATIVENNVDITSGLNNAKSQTPSFMLIRRTQQQKQSSARVPLLFNNDTNRDALNASVQSLQNGHLAWNASIASSSSTLSIDDTLTTSALSNLTTVNNNVAPSSAKLPSTIETLRRLSPDCDALNRKVFNTHGVDEYDRRNDDIDPVASCAEYELERRLDKMELFDVELEKGTEGLGVSIIGMGVGADAGLEKLGIFVKSITPGGAVHRDSRIRVCDQIVSVDGVSLVGVSQLFAAQTLRATSMRVIFTIGRETNLEDSEVAQLIQQSLEQDRYKLLAQVQHQQQLADDSSTSQRRQKAEVYVSASSNNRYLTSNLTNGNNESYDADEDSSRRVLPNVYRNQALQNSATATNENCTNLTTLRDKDILQNQKPFISNSAVRSMVTGNSGTAVPFIVNKNPGARDEQQIKAKIQILECELSGSQKKAEQMRNVLENTRTHYTQLENKYDEAKQLLKNYQEREKELLQREETHVVQLREKDAHYSCLVTKLKSRINELEEKLDFMDKQQTSLVEGELTELREQLAACTVASKQGNEYNGESLTREKNRENCEFEENNFITDQNFVSNTTIYGNTKSMHNLQQQSKNGELVTSKINQLNNEYLPAHNNTSNRETAPPPQLPNHNAARSNGSRHAGISQRAMPLSTAPPPLPQHYERFIINGVQLSGAAAHIYATAPLEDPIYTLGTGIFDNAGYMIAAQKQPNCESPVPRISEPASPAMPQKFLNNHNLHHKSRILFPLRKRYYQAENEFWRENVEAQGLQVLQWNTDEICQMLIHIGLDKYIPEFTVNQITGPKFLDLDGSRLKSMGIYNHSDRSIIKKKIKTIKSRIERERKLLERESRFRTASNIPANNGINKGNSPINGIPLQTLKMISIHQ